MIHEILQKYAQLLVRKGINVQRGQDVIVMAELDQPEFVTLCVEECYRAGARKVFTDWTHLPIARAANELAKDANALQSLESWELDKWRWQLDNLPAKLYLESEDPDGLNGIDQERYTQVQQARRAAVKPIRDQMENRYQWCIAAVPGKAWAKKMFPHLEPDQATEQLWYAILSASRALGDPIANWEAHNADLRRRYERLNSLNLRSLKYSSANGTDFTVGLLEDGCFLGGEEATAGDDVSFNPNIPSEEIFTAPQSGVADGIVFATKPLSWQGALIENFWVKFADGKVVDVGAERNESLLRQMIAMDEGASRIGEVALVPYESPISQSGLLFYNTLFDENASCHIALGFGISNCLKGFENMTQEEIHARGVNDSLIHVDFMIGSEDLNIVGTTRENEKIQIFQNGNWAF